VTQALVVAAKVLAGCGFLALLGLIAWFSFPRSAGRTVGSSIVYAGGMTSRSIVGSYGTARLELGDDEVVLHGRGPFRPFIRWAASYGVISEARAVRAPIGRSGLLLSAPAGNIAFWTPRWAEVLDLLELRAVPVSRAVTKATMQDF